MERAAARKETFDSSLLSMGILSFSFGASSGAGSFPFPLSRGCVTVAKSSMGTGGDLTRERVAERMLCSIEDRKRPLSDFGNALSVGGGDWENEEPERAGVGVVDIGCLEEEGNAATAVAIGVQRVRKNLGRGVE